MRTFWMFLFLCSATAATLGGAQVYAAEVTAQGVWAYTNAERYRAGLPMLDADPQLSQAALRKMQDLFTRQYFEHEAPTGEDVSDLVDDTGYAYLSVGENLALGDFSSSKDLVQAWMESPGHRANILATKFSEIGVAVGRSSYEGRMVWIAVQTFGLPRSSCPATHLALQDSIESGKQILEVLESVAAHREELLADKTVSRSVYAARVESYNIAATLYNERALEYRALIERYNSGVKKFNACLKEKTR